MKAKKELNTKESIDIKDNSQDVKGKVIMVMQSLKPDRNEIDYLITTDGLITKANSDSSNIVVCLFGNEINWTQKESLVTLVKELQLQGAGMIERCDSFNKKEINPIFDLDHLKISYSIK